jgi:hypothetical protein
MDEPYDEEYLSSYYEGDLNVGCKRNTDKGVPIVCINPIYDTSNL